jgi:predicted oxidoreductase
MKDANILTLKLDANDSWLGMGLAEISTYSNYKNNINLEKNIRYAINKGLKIFDVAPNYHEGRAEIALGKELSSLKNSKEITVFTKVGQLAQSEITNNKHWCFSPEFVDSSIERSISRLGDMDLDCVFLHNPEDNLSDSCDFLEKFSSTIDTLERLSESNAIKGWGISSWSGFFLNKKPPKLELTKILDFLKSSYVKHHLLAIQFPLGKWNLKPFLDSKLEDKNHFEGHTFMKTALSNNLKVVINSPFYGGEKIPIKEKRDGLSTAQQELLSIKNIFPDTIRLIGMNRKSTIDEAAELQ